MMNLIVRFRIWRLKRILRRGLRANAWFDRFMKSRNWPSWRRQQFWRDYITSPAARKWQANFIGGLYNYSRSPSQRKGKSRPGPPSRAAQAPGRASLDGPAITKKEAKNG